MIFRLILFFFATSFIFLAFLSVEAADYPEVTFEYSQIFNSTCAEKVNRPIEPTAVSELENRIDSFRDQWRKDASQLLGTTVKLTKAPFQFRETLATLSLCYGFPSMSIPLTINMRFYMKSLAGEKAASMTKFSDTVFHEVLHRYVNERMATLPGKTTPFLTKYKDEPLLVKNHLHVMAIMKLVYAKLGRGKQLEEDKASDEGVKRSNTPIKRAQEIVEKEGAEKFLAEISKRR